MDYTGFGTSCSGLEFDNNYDSTDPIRKPWGPPGTSRIGTGWGPRSRTSRRCSWPSGTKTVDELAALTFTATATDPDSREPIATFSLDAGAPAGATIERRRGAFSWTPTEAQGPGTLPGDHPRRRTTGPRPERLAAITITVNEVNAAPVLVADRQQDRSAGCDAGLHGDRDRCRHSRRTRLTFSLDSGAPAGATINASTGAFSWTPTEPRARPLPGHGPRDGQRHAGA